MKNLFFIVLIIIVSPTVFGQTITTDWTKRYQNPQFENLTFNPSKFVADNNGNLVVGGDMDTLFNIFLIRLMKLDSNGILLWQLSHNVYSTFATTHTFHDLTTDATGNIYVAYEAYDSVQFGTSRWCVMKLNANGSIIWDKMYTGIYGDAAYPTSIKVDGNGNVYTTGLGSNTSVNDNAMVVLKMNASGVLQWEKLIDGNAIDNGNTTSAGMDLVLDNNANVYIAGHLANYDTVNHFDLLLAKYSSSGALLWSKVVDDDFGSRTQFGQKVRIDSNGDVVVAGVNSSISSAYELFILKYNPSGSLIWKKTLNGFAGQTIADLGLDNIGNIYIASKYIPPFFSTEVGFVAKFNSVNGDTAWTFDDKFNTDWKPSGVSVSANGDAYAWGAESFNLPYTQARLLAFNTSGNIFADVINNTVNYQFNDLQTQNIVFVQNKLYASAWFINQNNSTRNGLLVKFGVGINTDISSLNYEKVRVYPNPFSGSISFSKPLLSNHNTIAEIFDVTGKKIFETVLVSEQTIIESNYFQSGIYFVHIKSEAGEQMTKLIKN